MMMRTFVGLGILVFAGCSGEDGSSPSSPIETDTDPTNEPDPVRENIEDPQEEGAVLAPRNVTLEPGVEVEPAPEIVPEPTVRARRRMNLDQLSAALLTVSEGIGWTISSGNGQEADQLVELASTLGKPDYVNITHEDLSPSALFQKFLEDAARSVCTKLADREARRPLGSEKILFEHVSVGGPATASPEAVEANLRSLLLRFHGRSLVAGAPALERWKWLVTSTAHVTGDAYEVWRTVCVALITHPDFYSY